MTIVQKLNYISDPN